MFLNPYLFMFGAGITLTFYGAVVDPQPVMLLSGAAIMGLPAFLRGRSDVPTKRLAECNDGKVRKFKVTRDTDLREIARIEDPINKQVKKDLKKLRMTKPKPDGPIAIGSPIKPPLKERIVKYPMAEPPRTPTQGDALAQGTYLMAAGDILKMTIEGEVSFYTCEKAGLYDVLNIAGRGEVHYVNDEPPPPKMQKILA